MRMPSDLTPWFTTDQLMEWVKEAPDKTAYQRRLAVWLTHAGKLPAHRIAELLLVSTQVDLEMDRVNTTPLGQPAWTGRGVEGDAGG